MSDLKKRIEEKIDDELERRVQFLCSDASPIGLVLRTALAKHDTPQCKVICFTEGMYSWYKITKEPFYFELTNCLIQYANLIFQNRIERNFLRNLILEQWLDFSNEEFPYLRMKVFDRMKSLESEINDLVDKTLKGYIALDFLRKVNEIFDDSECEDAKKILQNLHKRYMDSRNKDIYGIMFVLHYNNRIRDEDDPDYLQESALNLGKNCLKFMTLNGIEILGLKDYITKPKDGGYKCYQFVIRGTNNPLEIQIRSLSMHHANENPENEFSHLNYKNTTFNNYLNSIVDEVYGIVPENSKTFEEEIKSEQIRDRRYGVTDGIPLFAIDQIARTPNTIIPSNLEDLKKFEDIETLAELYAQNKAL